jgi:hypothetical protein
MDRVICYLVLVVRERATALPLGKELFRAQENVGSGSGH